jgi:hypothetical protein
MPPFNRLCLPAAVGYRQLGFITLPLLLSCLLLAQCVRGPVKPDPAAPVDLYVASREPLTYCPKGHQLPRPDTGERIGAEYVYLADRKTRFYIPHGCMAHRNQALELREASKDDLTRTKEHLLAATRPVAGLLGFYLLALPDGLGATAWSDEQAGRDPSDESKGEWYR